MSKFEIGDKVRIVDKRLLSYGKEFIITDIWDGEIYHGKLWNKENELELVERPGKKTLENIDGMKYDHYKQILF